MYSLDAFSFVVQQFKTQRHLHSAIKLSARGFIFGEVLFNSIVFAVFLLIVFATWWLPALQTVKRRNLLIILTGSVFYGWWDVRFLALLFFTATVDFLVARALENSSDEKKRRRLLLISLLSNLTVLGFFKYFNFFAESLAGILRAAGLQPDFVTLNIVLPVGISFYTFQALSYTIDVYRKQIPAVREAHIFYAFITFFPQLVAGPIARAPQLVPQLTRTQPFSGAMAASGLRLMLWGYIKKSVIADNLSPIADAVFAPGANYNATAVFIGALAFSIQVYCDFSGYSLIAKGTARLFGIELADNFRFPYFAKSLRDFWRRWHISLSTWFNDYVFSPITIRLRTHPHRAVVIALLCTFALSGLWHGAAWTFVLWGVIHGVALAVEFLYASRRMPRLPDTVRVILVLLTVAVSFIFFRSPGIQDALSNISSLFSSSWNALPDMGLPALYSSPIYIVSLLVMIVMVFVIEWLQYTQRTAAFVHWPKLLRWSVYYGALACLLLMGVYQQPPAFIYFQF